MRYLLSLMFVGGLFPASASAQTAIRAPVAAPVASPAPVAAIALSPGLIQRADDVVKVLNGEIDLAAIFAPEFLVQVPPTAIRQLSSQIASQLGRAQRVTSLVARDATTGSAVIGFERGTAQIKLSVGADGKIAGLLISGIEPATSTALTTLDAVAAEFRKLPGKTAFVVEPLSAPYARGTSTAAQVAPDAALAIGSSFKLVILAELVRQIDAGQRKWADVLTLDGHELPGGGYTQKPAGTRVSLRELAEAMIKVSDNSATDLMLFTLGRERVEAMTARLGWRSPRNRPFLGTMEVFKLKGVGGGALGTRYLASNLAGKRWLLAGEVAATKGSAIGPLFADGKPVRIDTLEWFASPRELAGTMRWFRDHGNTAGGAEALRILAVNVGPLGGMADSFGYIGYKGGSEPGVMSMTLLLRDRANAWTTISASWNNPVAAVNELAFTALVRRAAQLVASGATQR